MVKTGERQAFFSRFICKIFICFVTLGAAPLMAAVTPPALKNEAPPSVTPVPPAKPGAPATAAPPAPSAVSDSAADDDADDSDDETEGDDNASGEADPEAEAKDSATTDRALHYTTDLSDAEIEKRFAKDPALLGSISVGFADAGRLISGVQMPADPAWELVVPECAWGTRETVDFLSAAARAVHALFPQAAPLRINHIGKKEGGYLRPHRSHQSGRDVDLGFFYKNNVNPLGRRGNRAHLIDLAVNWALLRALFTQADVQVVLVDRRIQRVLYDYALAQGEDRAWLEQIFRGPKALVQHARRHRDHFHVRFYAARSQELGRRVQPILAQRPEENRIVHKVRSGDTLSHIARRYGTTVSAIQKANKLRGVLVRVGRGLTITLRGTCTSCPQPAPLLVPPRRLPPTNPQALAATPAAASDARGLWPTTIVGGRTIRVVEPAAALP